MSTTEPQARPAAAPAASPPLPPPPDEADRPRSSSRTRRRVQEALLGYLMLVPSMTVFVVFVFYPFFKNFETGRYLSPLPGQPGPGTDVGFEQFSELLDLSTLANRMLLGLGVGAVAALLVALVMGVRGTRKGDPPGARAVATRSAWVGVGIAAVVGTMLFLSASDTSFANSLGITFQFWLYTVPPTMILGTALAILGHRVLKGMGVYRTLFMMSLATGVGVAGTIFFTFLNPQVGLLPWLGLETRPPPLENPTWAMPSVSVFAIWLNLGLAFIVISAGLQNVPDELYEAARVDGAGPWRRFWQVTVPLLSPTLLFVFVVGSITSLIQSYPYIDVTTGGGPLGKTETLPWLIVDTLRGTSADRGAAAVYSIALFVIALVLTLVQLRVLERRVHYGGGER